MIPQIDPSSPKWVDTHGHLHDPAFEPDREAVIERTIEALTWCVDPGVDAATSASCVAEAECWSGKVWAAVGIHPNETARASSEALAAVERLCDRQETVAIGEVGLDFYRITSPPEVQERVLERELAWAADRDLPVILHVRDAYERMLDVLGPSPAVQGVVHAFWGDSAVAFAFIDRGFYLGVGGALTFRKEKELRAIIAQVPRERIVLETDAPYLTPEPFRGRRNEPALVGLVGRKLAQLWGISEFETAHITNENAKRLFLARKTIQVER